MTDSTDVDKAVDQRRSDFRGLYRALRGQGLWIDVRVTDGLLEFFVPETIYVETRAMPPLDELPIEAHSRERAPALPRALEQQSGSHFTG